MLLSGEAVMVDFNGKRKISLMKKQLSRQVGLSKGCFQRDFTEVLSVLSGEL